LNNSATDRNPETLVPEINGDFLNNIYTLDHRLDEELSFNRSGPSGEEEEESTKDIPVPHQHPEKPTTKKEHPILIKTMFKSYHPQQIHSAKKK
jgi:hypothetical protein